MARTTFTLPWRMKQDYNDPKHIDRYFRENFANGPGGREFLFKMYENQEYFLETVRSTFNETCTSKFDEKALNKAISHAICVTIKNNLRLERR